MVHSSAFHPYTRPVTQDVSYDDTLRLLIALTQAQDTTKGVQLFEPKEMSPPIVAPPVLTPNPVVSPTSSIPEQSIHSPAIPNEKSRRKRTTFSPEQATRLESEFLSDSYMPREKRLALAHSLNLSENQVKTWFQNRRAKDKRDRKVGDSPNTIHSRKSSPSRKSSSDSSPTPSLMASSTSFILPSSHQIQIATSPTTVESSTPPETVIQKVEQFSVNHNLPDFDVLNNYLNSLSTNTQLSSQFPSIASPSPLFNAHMLMNFPAPVEPSII